MLYPTQVASASSSGGRQLPPLATPKLRRNNNSRINQTKPFSIRSRRSPVRPPRPLNLSTSHNFSNYGRPTELLQRRNSCPQNRKSSLEVPNYPQFIVKTTNPGALYVGNAEDQNSCYLESPQGPIGYPSVPHDSNNFYLGVPQVSNFNFQIAPQGSRFLEPRGSVTPFESPGSSRRGSACLSVPPNGDRVEQFDLSVNDGISGSVLQGAVPTPQYTGQNLVVEGTHIKKPFTNVPKLHIGHKFGQNTNSISRHFSNFTNIKPSKTSKPTLSHSNLSSRLFSLKRSSSESSLIRPTRLSRAPSKFSMSRKTNRTNSARTRSRTSRGAPNSAYEVTASTYSAGTDSGLPDRRSRSRRIGPSTLPKCRTVKSDQTRLRAASGSDEAPRSYRSAERKSNTAIRSPRGRVFSSRVPSSSSSATFGNPASVRPTPVSWIGPKAGSKSVNKKLFTLKQNSPLALRNGQTLYGANYLKQMIFTCSYYILEQLPNIQVEQASVERNEVEKVFRKVTIILPAILSIYLPNYYEEENSFSDVQLQRLNKDDEGISVVSSDLSSRKPSFACDYSTSNDTKSFSFISGLRSVLKDGTKNCQDSTRCIKNVVFRSPIESAREASFDESMSTLIDGSSAESRELSFLACQLENANLIQEEEQQNLRRSIRRNTNQLKRQNYQVLRTLRNLAMQRDNSRNVQRSNSVGDLTCLTSKSESESSFGDSFTITGCNDFANQNSQSNSYPFVPKIFETGFENLEDNSSLMNVSLNGQNCSTNRLISGDLGSTPTYETTENSNSSFVDSTNLNRVLTRQHNEMNWKRRQFFDVRSRSRFEAAQTKSHQNDSANLGLTIVGLHHRGDMAQNVAPRRLNEFNYRYRRQSR